MRKLFVDNASVNGAIINIKGNDVNHIKNVLRKKAGDSLLICDQSNNEYTCVIKKIENEIEAEIKSVRQSDAEPSTRVTIYQGLAKGEKMDWIIQKCVELGAYDFVPVMMRNCVVKLDEKSAEAKTERWQRVATEAAKQCGRGLVPKVYKPISYNEALINAKDKTVIILSEYEKQFSLKQTLTNNDNDNIAVFVGAEGGFDPVEIEQALNMGAHTVTLGKRILRTETAAMAALAMILYEYGDMGG